MLESNKKSFAEAGLIDGPGGWRCPCCNPYSCAPRKMKPLARRFRRRKEKMEIRNNVEDLEN